ncbi:hypothetical protein [Paenibacillus puerhi]|uniref:hypothetical protein n=1 Tax=Paenibacillus puerhi TaxID=2692622 RepID=UPI001358BA36|nr:hypothetical protein [Paenibacillus puerhi]
MPIVIAPILKPVFQELGLTVEHNVHHELKVFRQPAVIPIGTKICPFGFTLSPQMLRAGCLLRRPMAISASSADGGASAPAGYFACRRDDTLVASRAKQSDDI